MAYRLYFRGVDDDGKTIETSISNSFALAEEIDGRCDVKKELNIQYYDSLFAILTLKMNEALSKLDHNSINRTIATRCGQEELLDRFESEKNYIQESITEYGIALGQLTLLTDYFYNEGGHCIVL